MIQNKLSETMGRKRIKMAELARIAGVSRSVIYELYHDKAKVLKFSTLNKICWALECTIDDIFEYIPDEEAL